MDDDLRFPPFVPHFLVPTGHLQTLAGAYWPGIYFPHRALHLEVVLDDGDRVVVHDDLPPNWEKGSRVVLLLHGLGGSHRSPAMERTAGKLVEKGVRAFRLDMRGCGAGGGLSRALHHAGRSDDIRAVIRQIAEWCPESPLTLVGFSLGGNVTLKTIGELGDDRCGGLDSAAAIAPPLDLEASSSHISTGFNQIYDRYFAWLCLQLFAEHRRQWPEFRKLPINPAPLRLRDFDDRYTAPLSGFSSVDDYYHRASAARVVDRIRIPTLVITAADDPAVPVESFRVAPFSSSVVLRITEHGGHLGHIGAGGVDPDNRWLEWRVVEWVEEMEKRRKA